MAKNQVSIKINAQDNASTPIQKVTARLNETTASIKKAQAPLQKLQNSFINFSLAVPGVKLLGSAMAGLKKNVSECVTAFAEIEKSTKQLQFAQNVNVQLKAVGADLTRFAADMSKNFRNVFSQGEIQSAITELSFDHTYDEIEKITRVAGDLASATGMTLSQAVDALANTMNGRLSQELKRIVPELASLDSEALKSGKAIDVLGQKLSGLAGDMSGTTGASITAFNNTVGDLKENLGSMFSESMTPMRNYFTELLGNLNSAISEFITLKHAKKAVDNNTATSSQYLTARSEVISGMTGTYTKGWWSEDIAGQFYDSWASGKSIDYEAMAIKTGKSVSAITMAFDNFASIMNGTAEDMYGWEDSVADVTDMTRKYMNALQAEAKEREEAARAAKELTIATETATTATETAGETAASSFSGFGPNVMMGLKLRDSVNSGAMFEGLGLRGLGGGYDSSMDAPMPENTYSAMAGASTSIFGTDVDIFKGITELTDSFSLLNEIMNPVTTIFTSIIETLDPVVSSLLKPINNMLKILGQFIAQIMIPVFQMLTPVVDALTKAFTWLYNKVLLPVGNSIISLFNIVYNSIVAVCNGLIWLYNAIAPKSWEKDYISYRSLDSGHMSELTTDAVANYGSTGSTSSGGASYTAARDITVNIYYDNSYVNGDAREIAINLRNEIRLAEALGY